MFFLITGMQYVVPANPTTNHISANIQSANQMSTHLASANQIATSSAQIMTMAPNQVVGIVQNQNQIGRTIGQRNQMVTVPPGGKIVSQGNQVVQQGGQIIRLVRPGDQIGQPQSQISNMNQINNMVQPANMQNVVRVVQNTNELANVAQNSRMISSMPQVQNTGYVNSSTQQVRSGVNQNVPQSVITSNHYQVVPNILRNNQAIVNGTMPAHTVTTMSNYGTKQTRIQQPGTSNPNAQQNRMQYLNRTNASNVQQHQGNIYCRNLLFFIVLISVAQ